MPAFTFLSSEDDMRDRHERSGEVETFSLRTSPRLIHCIESNTSHGQYLVQLTADSAHHNKVEPAPQLSWQCHSSKEAVGRGCCPFWSSGMTKVSSQTSPVARQSTNPHFQGFTASLCIPFAILPSHEQAQLHSFILQGSKMLFCVTVMSMLRFRLPIRLDFKGETELPPLNSSVPSCLLRRINSHSKGTFTFISSE